MKLSPLPFLPDAEVEAWLAAAEASAIREAAPLLGPLFASAPYLFDLARRHDRWLAEALTAAPGEVLGAVLAGVCGAGEPADEAGVSDLLRDAKGKVALLAAIAETGGAWSTAQSTAALSDFADAALDACVEVLIRRAGEKPGRFTDPQRARAVTSGLALFALGKHGGRELNYSSDIDIVAFYDPRAGLLAEPEEAPRFYARLVQRLAGMMQDRTAAGYVFRTDLRLRPDPGSTAVAIPLDAALAYYESRGQNWERAAWIKARACAGDIGVGESFLRELAPYVWRRHLDFATIADIQAMKRQINIAKNVGAARVEGHNVKLGRGGIREIEFFTQTQQLIAGGREPALRVRPTSEALAALAAANWITPAATRDLTGAYWFLRAVENRLQMRGDEQTHTMPEDDGGVSTIAALMGEADPEQFRTRYRTTLETVSRYYAELFAEGESLGTGEGSLVFTGSDDDPETLETLSTLGFADPHTASETIRRWHYGGYAATRAAAARAHLTELLPKLLRTISGTGNADEALSRFDNFLSRLPSGVQLFSLLRQHGELRRLLVGLMASAPRMAEAVIHRAHVMDALIDPAFADEVTRPAVLAAKVDSFLGESRDYQELIDRARIVGQEQKFLVAAGFLSGTISTGRAGEQFTALAETLLARLFASVRDEFALRHGHVPGAQATLLGFGKMAGREMTFTSDLDFIMLYEAEAEGSDGERPLSTSHYFTRLTQRLVAAITSPTAEGVLYAADLRLRPSGNAGPLATSLPAFAAYHREHAWTWEHLALTRARVVAGDAALAGSLAEVIAAQLASPRDPGKIVDDVLAMRALMAKERPQRHAFDLKLATGGLIDLEFIAQSGQLLAGATIAAPQAPTATVLARMGASGLLPEGERLVEIHGLYSTVLEATSAALLQPFREDDWTGAFRDLLARLTNVPTFERLVEEVAEMREVVSAAAERWYARARAL